MQHDMREADTKEDAERRVAERNVALAAAKASNAEPGNHVRGLMLVRQAAEALALAEATLASFR